MKILIKIFLLLLGFSTFAQNDYTGKIVHVVNTLTVSNPTGKLFIVDANEDSLYLPAPSSVTGQMIAVVPNPYTAFIRLNQNVTYRYNSTTGFYTVNFLYKTTQVSYLYSNGTSYEYYINYIPTALSATALAIDQTLIASQLPYNATSSVFGKTLDFSSGGGMEQLNLPNPSTLSQISFKIVNQGTRLLKLNYPFKVDGTTRTTITHTEGGNMWELIAEGGIYRAISNH